MVERVSVLLQSLVRLPGYRAVMERLGAEGMKFLHTGDWHLGKRLYEVSLIEEQRDMLRQIEELAAAEQVDAVVIAGDVYDRPIPPAEAVELLDDFLTKMVKADIPVLLISGNHDSPQRVAFGGQILEKQGVHIAGPYEGGLKTVTLQDAYGEVEFICMPFVKPAVLGCAANEEAVRRMLESQMQPQAGSGIVPARAARRVLITHYFVTGEGGAVPELSDSETDINVGGLDSVPAALFREFSYVALGHIHKPQRLGERIYYAGAPLKYSFSEARTVKSVQLVTMDGAGDVELRSLLLTPLRDVRCIKGRLEELIRNVEQRMQETGCSREDYLQVTLTDTEELIDPISTLRSVYPNVLQILMEKNMADCEDGYVSGLSAVHKSTGQLFSEFYQLLREEELDGKRREIAEAAAESAEQDGRME